jgi:hypothetical protein
MRYRILGNTLQIWPPATTTSRLGLEYMSKSWVVAVDGTTYKTSFTADTDSALYPDRLMITGAKFELWNAKGLDVTTLRADYDDQLEKAKAQDKGAPTLSMGNRSTQMFISPGSIPDSGYGQQ